MKRAATKFVSRFLTEYREQSRLNEQIKVDSNISSKVITDEKSWYYTYYLEIKQRSSQRKLSMSQRPKSGHQVDIKTILICSIDVKGIVYTVFVPPNQTLNQTFYLVVLKR